MAISTNRFRFAGEGARKYDDIIFTRIKNGNATTDGRVTIVFWWEVE
jgi:hypothetical protein